jgi:hypothetical protein
MELTEEVITQLGFGEYWGDSGESGTRYLSDPNRPGYSLMRIHDIDEMQAGSYGGYREPYSPQHYTTDDWRTITTVEELLIEADSRKWPGAGELLRKNMELITGNKQQ